MNTVIASEKVLIERGQKLQFEPHQLDFDWRFSQDSIAKITSNATFPGRILLLGCPTLVLPLEQLGKSGTLVERNPNYGRTDRFDLVRADLRFERLNTSPNPPYDQCVIDPPWYPQELLSWMKSGLSIIPVGGRVLFTLWPLEIRASSGREHAEIFDALSGIGKVEELGRVDYDLPPFEKMTLSESRLSPPKRKGLLLRLTKSTEKQLEVSPFSRARSEWHRFTISGEQVAIKVDLDSKDCDHDWSFKVDPFVLRSTSRRDPVLSTINIWTSRNVVARLANPSSVARGIAEHQQIHLRMLAEKMNMEFDPDNIRWGMSWQHPA